VEAIRFRFLAPVVVIGSATTVGDKSVVTQPEASSNTL
jgi:hypothetical protein